MLFDFHHLRHKPNINKRAGTHACPERTVYFLSNSRIGTRAAAAENQHHCKTAQPKQRNAGRFGNGYDCKARIAEQVNSDIPHYSVSFKDASRNHVGYLGGSVANHNQPASSDINEPCGVSG
jgi:hypothetical protein